MARSYLVHHEFGLLSARNRASEPVRLYRTGVGIDTCIQARDPSTVKLWTPHLFAYPYSVLMCRTMDISLTVAIKSNRWRARRTCSMRSLITAREG